MRSPRTLSVISVSLIVLAACGGGDDATTSTDPSTDAPSTEMSAEPSADSAPAADAPSGEPGVITISDSRFDQAELRVAAGTTVQFVNTDPYAHTVTSKDDSAVAFASGEFGQDETFEFTFDEPGEFAYFCEIHPTMRAEIIVE